MDEWERIAVAILVFLFANLLHEKRLSKGRGGK